MCRSVSSLRPGMPPNLRSRERWIWEIIEIQGDVNAPPLIRVVAKGSYDFVLGLFRSKIAALGHHSRLPMTTSPTGHKRRWPVPPWI